MRKKKFTSTFKKSTFKKGRAKSSSLKKRNIGLAQPFSKVEKVEKVEKKK